MSLAVYQTLFRSGRDPCYNIGHSEQEKNLAIGSLFFNTPLLTLLVCMYVYNVYVTESFIR